MNKDIEFFAQLRDILREAANYDLVEAWRYDQGLTIHVGLIFTRPESDVRIAVELAVSAHLFLRSEDLSLELYNRIIHAARVSLRKVPDPWAEEWSEIWDWH